MALNERERLAEVDRRIAECNAHIAHQCEVIEGAIRDGRLISRSNDYCNSTMIVSAMTRRLWRFVVGPGPLGKRRRVGALFRVCARQKSPDRAGLQLPLRPTRRSAPKSDNYDARFGRCRQRDVSGLSRNQDCARRLCIGQVV
jgi:hypothetical protein